MDDFRFTKDRVLLLEQVIRSIDSSLYNFDIPYVHESMNLEIVLSEKPVELEVIQEILKG